MTNAINETWVTVKVELNGKHVSAIYGQWLDNFAVTLSARPFTGDDFSAAVQAERFLTAIEFAPYQNIGEPEFEAAVEPATANLKEVLAEWKESYSAAEKEGKLPAPVYCREFPEFDIIITTMIS